MQCLGCIFRDTRLDMRSRDVLFALANPVRVVRNRGYPAMIDMRKPYPTHGQHAKQTRWQLNGMNMHLIPTESSTPIPTSSSVPLRTRSPTTQLIAHQQIHNKHGRSDCTRRAAAAPILPTGRRHPALCPQQHGPPRHPRRLWRPRGRVRPRQRRAREAAQPGLEEGRPAGRRLVRALCVRSRRQYLPTC